MKKFGLNEILNEIKVDYKIVGNKSGIHLNNIKTILEANDESLVWINPDRKDKNNLLLQTKAKVIICDDSLDINKFRNNKVFIIVNNPKEAFINVVNEFFVKRVNYSIHPSAIIHPEAEIDSDIYIGPFTYIGKSKIGQGTKIYGHSNIYDNVVIGENVIIHAGCIIGVEGFSYTRKKDGTLLKFPHIGGVIIEDDVEIQGMTNVDKGTLDNTIIGKGTKIDTQCHIGHNSVIGQDTIITARTMLGGSTKIGNRCWIGPCTTVRDGGIRIYDDSFIGIGSLVVKDIEYGGKVMGHPAKPIEDYKKYLKALRIIIENYKKDDKKKV